MIIESLMQLVYRLLSIVLTPLNIDGFPAGTEESVTNFFNIIFESSESLIGLLVPSFTFLLIGIIIVVELGIHLYHFVMWVLRKIPLIAID